jgi:hypothetical protein
MSADETAQADTNAARVKKCGAGAGGARRKRNLITGWNYSSSRASKALFVPIMGEIQVENKPTNGMPCAPYTAAWSFLSSDAHLKIWSWRDQFKRQDVSRFTVRMISSIFNRI